MANIKIVTDGSADVPPALVEELGIEVVPVLLHVDERVYRSGLDMTNEQFFELFQHSNHHFEASSPGVALFEQLYRRLSLEYDHIFSIHMSSKLSGVHRAAVQARSKLPASMTRVELIDSKSASMGLGSTVIAAARAVRSGASPDEVGQLINSLIQHTHVAFFVDTMEHLEHSGRLTLATSVLGSMQRIKPLMILDEGEIVPYERTRTRAKAIEGLYTFVEDFPHVQDVTILHVTTPEDVEKLIEKLEPIFPRERVQIAQFGPAVATHLGSGAMGVVVFEGIE
ncbi:MAG: DegV family protein [Chloroflexaceae bacterium]|nr:DegV family protein [Chloroflexaceae bacterium]